VVTDRGVHDGEELLVVHFIVDFSRGKFAGVKGHRVKVAIVVWLLEYTGHSKVGGVGGEGVGSKCQSTGWDMSADLSLLRHSSRMRDTEVSVRLCVDIIVLSSGKIVKIVATFVVSIYVFSVVLVVRYGLKLR
jgi:hypothetical protein